MPRITLLPDVHGNEDIAERYQRFTESERPDLIFLESGSQINGENYIAAVQEYSSLDDIYDRIGIGKDEDHQALNLPIYALSREDFIEFGEPIQEFVNSNFESQEDVTNNTKLGERKALHVFEKRKQAFTKENYSTLDLRLSHSAGFMDTQLHGMENQQDRYQAFRYGADEIEELPDNPNEVERIFRGVYHKEMEEINEISDQELVNYVLGCRKLLDEYNPTREGNMAEFIESKFESENFESAVAVVGKNHTEGVEAELPDNWNIDIVDLTGEPIDWSVKQQ